MNALIVGKNSAPILDYVPRGNFLIIDDGPVIDQLSVRARTFDPSKHSLSLLKDISYRSACDFVSVLEAAFPGGSETLTKQNTSMEFLTALLGKPKSFATLIKDTKETKDAYNKLQRLLISPVLGPILTASPRLNFSLKGTLIARLNRKELGEFDAFFLGNLLISRYPGTVIIPDFGFYAADFHISLIRQNRLIAGLRSFEEVPELKTDLVQIGTKVGSQCTPDDAEVLAAYSGYPKGTDGYSTYVQSCVTG